MGHGKGPRGLLDGRRGWVMRMEGGPRGQGPWGLDKSLGGLVRRGLAHLVRGWQELVRGLEELVRVLEELVKGS